MIAEGAVAGRRDGARQREACDALGVVYSESQERLISTELGLRVPVIKSLGSKGSKQDTTAGARSWLEVAHLSLDPSCVRKY